MADEIPGQMHVDHCIRIAEAVDHLDVMYVPTTLVAAMTDKHRLIQDPEDDDFSELPPINP